MAELLELRLTVDQINTILKYLGQGPFIEVSNTIVEIKTQAESQINKNEDEVV